MSLLQKTQYTFLGCFESAGPTTLGLALPHGRLLDLHVLPLFLLCFTSVPAFPLHSH